MPLINLFGTMFVLTLLHGVAKLELKDLEREAYACAMRSDKTDYGITRCYTERGLDAPF